jgi:hypothetical protein
MRPFAPAGVGVQAATQKTPADFAAEAAAIQANATSSRNLVANPNIVSALKPKVVDLSKLIYPESRQFADPKKLLDHGPFDWKKYTPIWVETDGTHLWLINGVTRVENAQRAGIMKLPAVVFPRD